MLVMPPDLTDKTREDLAWEIVRLRQENAELKRMVFGRKAERFIGSGPDGQLSLDLGADQKASTEGEPKTEEITYTRQKKQGGVVKIHPGRAPLPAHLPRVEVTIEPAEDTEGLLRIGEEITEELDYKPGTFFVRRYRRPKYAKADGEGVLIGSLPTRPIDKGIPGPGLLAQILVDKYVDHLPLYRQGKRFERQGVKIADSTLGDWLRQAIIPLQPLYEAMKSHLLNSSYIQADETTIKVLDKDKKGSTHLGYYWVYHAPESRIALFDYQKGRGREGPAQFLQHYHGDLQCDGYEAYELFESRPGVRVLNCMAHGRRYFEKAQDNDQQRAAFVLEKMQALYAIERRARELHLDVPARLALRQQNAVPILEELRHWLKANLTDVLPKSTIGEAIAYNLRRWDKLCIYASDGRLEIDNNLVENTIRPVALGRKNYLFAGSHDSAQRAAILYSILASCKICNVNPLEYLTDVLGRIQDHPINAIENLLPYNWKPL